MVKPQFRQMAELEVIGFNYYLNKRFIYVCLSYFGINTFKHICDMRMSHDDISYKKCTSKLLICSFFKTLNPLNFQTNNTRKLPLVQMNKHFKSFTMMYHKCQKSQISKSPKTLNKKKKWTEHKVPPQNSFGLEKDFLGLEYI